MGGLLFNLALICFCFIVLVLVDHLSFCKNGEKRSERAKAIQVYKNG